MEKIKLDVVRHFFAEAIPFNKYLGLELEFLDHGHAIIAVAMRPEFVGDPVKQIVHGGLLSTLIDVTGGLTAFSTLIWPRETSLNTIDMRVDYIKMGKGARFTCEGTVVRKGNRIIVTRTDVKDDQGNLIALGTATYNIFSSSKDIPDAIREMAAKLPKQ